MRKSQIRAYVDDRLDELGYPAHMHGWVAPGRLEVITRAGYAIKISLPASSAMKLAEVERRISVALSGSAPPAPPPMPAWMPTPGSPQFDLESFILQTQSAA